MASNEKINWPDPASLEWDKRKVTLENRPRRMIRIDCTSGNGASVGGIHVKHGRQFALVYEHQLTAIRAALPTDAERAMFAQAREQYAALMEGAIDEAVGTGASAEDRARAEETAKRTVGFNPWGLFHRLANPNPAKSPKRDYPCIDGLEVHPDPVAPPETQQGIAQAQAASMTDALARALDRVLGAGKKQQTA